MNGIAERIEKAVRRREEELKGLQTEGIPVVGTLASFAPPFEIVEAAGCVPVRLLHGGASDFETRGLRYLKNESCSLLKGIFGALASGEGVRPDAVVVGGACDQLRRAEEIFGRDFGIPTFALDVPRAHGLPGSAARLRGELLWLSKELASLSGSLPPGAGVLETRLRAWSRARDAMRLVDRKRREGVIDGSDALFLARSAWILSPESFVELCHSILDASDPAPPCRSAKKLLLTGPPVLLEDGLVFRVLRSLGGAEIVSDVMETGIFPHSSDVEEGADPWKTLADRANLFPMGCGFKRPDTAFVEAVRSALIEGGLDGVLFKSLSFCAPWNHQASRFRRLFPKPFLALEGDYSKGQESRVKTRLGAFLESLVLRGRGSNPR